MIKTRSSEDKIFDFINYSVLVIVLVIILYPLVYVMSASISEPRLVSSGEMWLWPKEITFEGYARVFNNLEIWIGYRNTIFYTFFGTVINLIVTLPAAYALSRKDLPARDFITKFMIITMFFSGGLIPMFILVNNLNLINTVWAMLLPGAASFFNIVVTRTYFQTSIPDELEEAAFIDGCSDFRIFFMIVLPLSAPIIAVMALFYGIGHWNQYFNALIFLRDRKLFPLQLFLREILIINQMNMSSTITPAEAEAMAAQARMAELVKYVVMIVASLPVLMIYPALQKYFVKGVMIGSLKG